MLWFQLKYISIVNLHLDTQLDDQKIDDSILMLDSSMTFYQSIHYQYHLSYKGDRGDWSQSQLTLGERQGTHSGHQHIARPL